MYNDYNVLLQQRHLLQAEHFFMFYNPLSYRKCLNIIYAWCPLTLNHLSTAFSLPCSDDFKTKQKNSIPSSQPFFFFFFKDSWIQSVLSWNACPYTHSTFFCLSFWLLHTVDLRTCVVHSSPSALVAHCEKRKIHCQLNIRLRSFCSTNLTQ